MTSVSKYWDSRLVFSQTYNANYLKFFERARTEWLRSLGHSQERLRVETGVMFVVTDTAVSYRSPARLDDLLDVTVHVKHAGLAQMTIAQQAWRSDAQGEKTLLAEGTIRIACVNAGTFRPQRVPISITSSLNKNNE